MTTKRKIKRELKKDGFKLKKQKSQEWIDNYDEWETNRDKIGELMDAGDHTEAQKLLERNRYLYQWFKDYKNA